MGDLFEGRFRNSKPTLSGLLKDLTIKLRQNGFNSRQLYIQNYGKSNLLRYLEGAVANIDVNERGSVILTRLFDLQEWPGERKGNSSIRNTAEEIYKATIRFFDYHYAMQHSKKPEIERKVQYG